MEVLEQAKIVSHYSDDRGSYSHTGVDVLSNVNNRNVRAVARGKVIEVQNRMEDSFIVNQKSPTYLWAGNYVVIEHGNGYVSRYNHLKYNSINVQVGDIVEEGHEIAVEGESGYATGVHLDFEVKLNGKFVDPSQYALGQANLPAYEEPKPVEAPVQEQPVEQSMQKLQLPADAEKWRVYPMDKAPIVGNECGFLLPGKFGGLEYDIIGWSQPDVAIIQTRDFGTVQIYVAPGTNAVIK